MELLDYLRMLRRGWATILLVTLVGGLLAGAYVARETDEYSSTSLILVQPSDARSLSELQFGVQYINGVANTYAAVIDSPEVLTPTAHQLGLDGYRQLPGSVSAGAVPSTGLIAITATASSARAATDLANATAASAQDVLPTMTVVSPKPGTGGTGDSLVNVSVIQAAGQPGSPNGVSSSRVIVVGLLIGLALGVAATITWQSVDTRLRRPDDVLDVSDVPLLAVIPRLRRRQRTGVLVRWETTGSAVEAYRSLRTNVSGAADDPVHTLLVTSVDDARAGALVPANLAWSIAQAGRRVLLIDLDLRTAPISELLRLTGRSGVTDVLSDQLELADVVRETSQPNLHVLQAGTSQPNPSDLLSGPAMVQLLRRAQAGYDYVVLHAPPLLTSSDAVVVSRLVEHTLVTVTANHTRTVELGAALGALATVRVKPLGLALTGARGSGELAAAKQVKHRPRAVAEPQHLTVPTAWRRAGS